MNDAGSHQVSSPSAIPASIWILLGSRVLDSAAAAGLVTIIGKQVFDMTGNELSLGLLGLAEFLPTAVLAPFAGSVADRIDRRLIGAAGSIGFGLISLGLFLYIGTDPVDAGPIYALMFAFGVVRAFSRPAVRALPIDLAPPALTERVVAFSSVSWQAGVIIGPVLSGFLFAAAVTLPYAVFLGMFLAAGAALFVMPTSGVERLITDGSGPGQAIRDALEGLRFIRQAPIVGAAITLDLFAVLLGGAVALLPAIAEDRLGVGAVGLGWLRAAVGIGAATVTLGLAWRPVSRRVGPVLLGSIAVFGVATIALGLTRSFVVALICLIVLGGADSISVFIRATIVPLATPAAMRGRVLALESVFIGASNELGAFESGVTAAWFGLVGAVVFGGAGTLAVVGAFWFLFPALRHIDRFADARPASATSAGRS